MPDAESSASHSNPPIIVIFGITGDLSQRYLLPALYHLIKDGLLDRQAEIVGITRREITAKQLFEQTDLCVNDVDKVCDPAALKFMHNHTRMIQMDLNDPRAYTDLLDKLNDIETAGGICMNRLYYLSIPPQVYRPVIRHMGEQGLNASCQHDQAVTRLLVEKPFGFDLSSAKELISETGAVFHEDQIFRIDHFLAKETVQNILTFRSKNPIFEASWNRGHISSIEISTAERITIEGRAHFYDQLGALRDFIQNHLMQLLAIVAMDKPEHMDSDHVHAAKKALLEQLQPMPPNQVASRTVRGQYRGYLDEVDSPDSVTETYAAITLTIDSERWRGVPVTLTTGKAMAEKKYEITVNFVGREGTNETANRLRFRIQPHEGIELELHTKKPGFDDAVQSTAMDFSYENHFDNHQHPDAYERVLLDAVRGDHTLFATSEEILASWRVIQPILDEWSKNADDLIIYDPGTQGPLAKAQ